MGWALNAFYTHKQVYLSKTTTYLEQFEVQHLACGYWSSQGLTHQTSTWEMTCPTSWATVKKSEHYLKKSCWHWHGLQTSDAGKVKLSQKNLTINWWQENDDCNVMVHSGSNSQLGSATNMADTFWGLTQSVLWQVGVVFVLHEGQTAFSLHSLQITAVLCDWNPTLTYIVTSFGYKL